MENELILFETADKEIKLTVPIKNNTVWLNRKQLAELFGRDVKTIGKHINNALKEELDNSVVANFATTASDGKVYQIEHYNLDMIISIGYRVKSNRGVEFRKWANSVLKQYIMDAIEGNESGDKSAQNIFSYKPIMGNILKYTVAEYKDCSLEEIMECIEGDTIQTGTALVEEDMAQTIRGERTETNATGEPPATFDVLFRSLLPNSKENILVNLLNTAEADLIEIIIVRLGGENQDQKGLVDFLYGLFSGNQEKVLSYIPDSDKPVRQKEVADMLSMISYAEENGIKKGEKKGENRLGTLMNILLKNKRYSDAEKASEDEEYREELYKEYKL